MRLGASDRRSKKAANEKAMDKSKAERDTRGETMLKEAASAVAAAMNVWLGRSKNRGVQSTW
jgi:hypothetical protein